MSLDDSNSPQQGPIETKNERTLAPGDATEELRSSHEEKDEINSHDCSSSSLTPDAEEDLESPPPENRVSAHEPETEEEQDQDSLPESSSNADTQQQQQKNNNVGCELSSVVIQSVDKLPPLPTPRHDILREETPRGICVVMTGIVLCVFLTHYIALTLVLPSENLEEDVLVEDEETSSSSYRNARIVFLALVYTESVVALLCATGILCADPGVVKRTEETCNPLPKAVESWVLTAPSQPRPKGLQGYLKGADQRLYCTKCLVWRDPNIGHYHCAICQRCCAYHDHHCNVFGRCIAGNPKFWKRDGSSSGNLLYFYGLLASGGWAFFTVFAAFLYAFSIRYRAAYAIPICLLIMLVVSCCCFGNGPIRIVCAPLRQLWLCARNCMRGSKRRR